MLMTNSVVLRVIFHSKFNVSLELINQKAIISVIRSKLYFEFYQDLSNEQVISLHLNNYNKIRYELLCLCNLV